MVGGDPQHQPDEHSREFSRERARLVAAVAKAAAEHGYAGLGFDQIASYAAVPRAIVELHFASLEQGVVAAQDAFLERLWLDAASAAGTADQWPRRVRAGLRAILDSLAEASTLARVFAIEASASLVVVERQLAGLDRFAALLRSGRDGFPRAGSLPEATERALVGGVASVVSVHLLMEEPARIPALEPDLAEFVLMPYLGRAEARHAAAAAI